ncbi:hypothetical protein IKG60_01300 [Candidatus Saccharibacteria bacterium]|nr:hypothetical protein [Candidatus Saccharibacteria bacterium]
MKNDLAIAVVTAIIGVVASYFICNIFVGKIEPVSIKTVESSVSAELSEPSPEIFNYRAINPTVEVFVGGDTECTEFDSNGNCLINQSSSEPSDDQGNQ